MYSDPYRCIIHWPKASSTFDCNSGQAVRSAGGRVAVQDELSAAVWGMPGAVVGAGLAGDTVEPDAMADYVVRAVGS